MFRHISRHGIWVGLCSLLLMAAFAVFGFAQQKSSSGAASQPQSQPYRMGIMHINPGMGPQFDALVKNELIPALRKAGVQEFGVWKTAMLGKPGTCVIASPIGSLKELDGPNPLVKALGQKGAADLSAKMTPLVTSEQVFIANMRPDLGMETAPGYAPKLGLQVTSTIVPGRTDDYEKNIKAISGAIKKAGGKGVYVAKTGIGGNPNEYRVLVLFDSFTDLESFMQPFVKAMAELKLEPQTGIVAQMEYAMFRYDPDLSIQAAGQ
jgi:hypothetical protein